MSEHFEMGAQGVLGSVGKRCRTDTAGGNTDFPTAAAVSGGGGDGRRRAATGGNGQRHPFKPRPAFLRVVVCATMQHSQYLEQILHFGQKITKS